MPKYIDPTKIKFIGDTFTDADKETYIRLSDVKQAIAQTPAEDVEEVKRGKWKWDVRFSDYCCSVCNNWDLKTPNYCSNCGAKMDGGKAE